MLLPDRSEATVAHVERHFRLDECEESASDYVVREHDPAGERILESWSELRPHLLANANETQTVYWSCAELKMMIILDFVEPSHLILGVSRQGASQMEAAHTMLELVEEFSGLMAYIGWEEPPPMSRKDFEGRLKGFTFASFRQDL